MRSKNLVRAFAKAADHAVTPQGSRLLAPGAAAEDGEEYTSPFSTAMKVAAMTASSLVEDALAKLEAAEAAYARASMDLAVIAEPTAVPLKKYKSGKVSCPFGDDIMQRLTDFAAQERVGARARDAVNAFRKAAVEHAEAHDQVIVAERGAQRVDALGVKVEDVSAGADKSDEGAQEGALSERSAHTLGQLREAAAAFVEQLPPQRQRDFLFKPGSSRMPYTPSRMSKLRTLAASKLTSKARKAADRFTDADAAHEASLGAEGADGTDKRRAGVPRTLRVTIKTGGDGNDGRSERVMEDDIDLDLVGEAAKELALADAEGGRGGRRGGKAVLETRTPLAGGKGEGKKPTVADRYHRAADDDKKKRADRVDAQQVKRARLAREEADEKDREKKRKAKPDVDTYLSDSGTETESSEDEKERFRAQKGKRKRPDGRGGREGRAARPLDEDDSEDELNDDAFALRLCDAVVSGPQARSKRRKAVRAFADALQIGATVIDDNEKKLIRATLIFAALTKGKSGGAPTIADGDDGAEQWRRQLITALTDDDDDGPDVSQPPKALTSVKTAHAALATALSKLASQAKSKEAGRKARLRYRELHGDMLEFQLTFEEDFPKDDAARFGVLQRGVQELLRGVARLRPQRGVQGLYASLKAGQA